MGQKAAKPIGPELARVSRETQLGAPLDDALGNLVKRNDVDELRLLLAAVRIHARVGGNLAEILDGIGKTIRERVNVQAEIRVLTAQVRTSGRILLFLPFGLSAALALIAPAYFDPMWQTGIGRFMLGGAAVSMLCGWGMINRLLAVRI